MKKILLILILLSSFAGYSQLQLPYSIKLVNPQPVDFYYGPWASLAAARTGVPLGVRYNGLTVRITGLGEYNWLSADLTDTGLVVKGGGTVTGGANGLSLSGSNIVLGGSLTGSTTIAAGVHPLILETDVTTGNGLDVSSATLTGGSVVKIRSTSTGHGHYSGDDGVLSIISNVLLSDDNSTTIGIRSNIDNTGNFTSNTAFSGRAANSATNTAADFTATGSFATNKGAIYFVNGSSSANTAAHFTATGSSSTNIAGYFFAGSGTNNTALQVFGGDIKLGSSSGTAGQFLTSGGSNATPTWTTVTSTTPTWQQVLTAGSAITTSHTITGSASTLTFNNTGSFGTSFAISPTVTSILANNSVFNLTPTITTSAALATPSLTMLISNPVTFGAASSGHTMLGMASNLSDGGFNNGVFIGGDYNPTETFTGSGTKHYAQLWQKGKVGFVANPTAMLHLKAGTATANSAPLKFVTGTALTTPEDGALEYHTSHLYFTIGATRYQLDQQAGGGGSVFSGLTAATGTNTINNAANAQEWQWNSLAGATGLKLSSTSTAAAGNALRLLSVEKSGANATASQSTRAFNVSNTSTGTSATNHAIVAEASGGLTNYALYSLGGGINLPDGVPISWADGLLDKGISVTSNEMKLSTFSAITFYNHDGASYSERMRLTATDGNLVIGTTTAAARLHSRGSGTTTAFNLLTENSSGTDRFGVLDNGEVQFSGGAGTNGQILKSAGTGSPPTWSSTFSGSTLETTGDFKASFTYSTSNITLSASHHTILIDATSATRTVTLPSALSANRRIYVIKKFDNVNSVTIDADGAETIDRVTTQTLSTQYSSITIQSDGTEWWILSNKN